ncbi:DNA internalization-related competence protein ComEC/Rec2 [Vibrio sp. CAU 1672]|uniref:DNA internalization-related competence protein ComEC/Rec2 n=1 Tax=Vibrio sp. CAU 1672 TaxID=3032594 RepID=UPI0023DA944F|nr:DNA internalization-related competence protein ComEC/Rec2 [Vibrio sp. CAU 1672]MDF2153630.1 DNA internalization-related competence protein ComEC/Rec2 [Vibrio sp. CAU 1672]
MTLSDKSWTLALFIITVISSGWWPTIPGWHWLVLAVVATGSMIKLQHGLISIGVIWGFVVVVTHANVMDYQRQALFRAGENITINGSVDSYFKQISHGYSGIVTVNSAEKRKLLPFLKPKIRLITPLPLAVNSHITTSVELKPIYGLRNEAGFDAEKYALSRSIIATGIVSDEAGWIIRTPLTLRDAIIQRVEQPIATMSHYPLLKALSFGDRTALAESDWEQLRDSGLLHLISISGLHIGMAFVIGQGVGYGGRLVIPNWANSPVWFGLFFAFVYAWLANFSLPTSRALMVCALYVMFKSWLIHWSGWRILLLSAAVQLSIHPFAVFGSSFWLSYLSVCGVLLAVSVLQRSKYSLAHKLLLIVALQFFLTVFLIPLSGHFFGGFSATSLLYNLLFIPWFGIVVIPMMFLALGFSWGPAWLGEWLWQFADWSLIPLTWLLPWAEGSWVVISDKQILLLVVICVGMLLRRFLHPQAGYIPLMVLLGVALFSGGKQHRWQFDVLDVGHGLAVLIEKDGKTLLYDTGKSWHDGSIAQQVIGPLLHQRGYQRLDSFIISHFDGDHAGGRGWIETVLSPRHRYASQSLPEYQACHSGVEWEWQGLKLEALWPPKRTSRAFNPHSCVVRITDPISGVRVLLTGDIEAISEWILARQPDLITSHIMLVPHHGSKTSSNLRFIEAVGPELAIASLAKGNQWGMPHDRVKSAYTGIQSQWLDTGEHGQVTVKVYPQFWQVQTKRHDTFGPWYRQMLRKGVE